MRVTTLDRILAVLVLTIGATGLLALKAGSPSAEWVFAIHGIVAGALLVAVLLKAARSVPPAVGAGRIGPVIVSLVLAGAIAGALVGGFAWVASGRLLSLGSWTLLTIHAWFGLAILPLVAIHLLPRRWRALRSGVSTGPSRRTVLVAGGLATVSIGAFLASTTMDRLLGGVRRFTGSRWLVPGSIPPATTFYGEAAPTIELDAWRIRIGGRTMSLDDLRAVGEVDVTAVLDCTSGWALETTWRGVPLASVLDLPDRGSVRVRSITGWSTVLSAEEARSAILATSVAGMDLPQANGAPCRLVVPGRRGLDWVKWVGEVGLV